MKHLQKLKMLYQLIEVASIRKQDTELQDLAIKAKLTLQDAVSNQGEFSAATRAALDNHFKFVMD